MVNGVTTLLAEKLKDALLGPRVRVLTWDEQFQAASFEERGRLDEIDGTPDIDPGFIAAAAGARWYQVGFEISFGRNFRIAPVGNRTGNRYGEWPHYHRRGAPLPNGRIAPGQGIGRHRPWEPKSTDTSLKDLF
jgi:hypothetical protein